METSSSRQHRPGAQASRQQAVELAEAYLRAHLDASVPLSTLCRIVGLSERGLRNAFYGVRGMSPKRSMLAERLQGVRRILRDAGARRTTVAGVATQFGFYELGRFAATYKEAFGEAPSETLRGLGRTSGAEHTPDAKGHGHACTSYRNHGARTGPPPVLDVRVDSQIDLSAAWATAATCSTSSTRART